MGNIAGAGERAERIGRRRFGWLMWGFLVAMTATVILLRLVARPDHTLPVAFAVGAAALYAIAVPLWTWRLMFAATGFFAGAAYFWMKLRP